MVRTPTVRATRPNLTSDDGSVLLFVAVSLVGILVFAGLCLDGGRAYLVKAQLSKAVDAAALGSARSLNSGTPSADAAAIFKANFKSGFVGTGATDPTTAANFYNLTTDTGNGINTVSITATVTMQTTLMKLVNIPTVTVTSSAQATRRMVDLSLVIDVSSSIGSQWPAVRDAARTFVSDFDANNDRMDLILFSNGANVLVPINSARGFNKTTVENAIPNTLPGGSTLMVEGVYRAWDELRSVPSGSQSSLRVIVLFTDGASNGVPGFYDSPSTAKAIRTYDFPHNAIDPDGQTWDSPEIVDLFDTQTGAQSPSNNVTVPWNSTTTLTDGYDNYLPTVDAHTHYRSAGIPTSFPLQVATLNVNGVPQSTARGLRQFNAGVGKYPAQVWNINNAARNLVEIIANSARADASGAYPIRIYSIGMSYLLLDLLGTIPETPQSILQRVANDPASPDFNSAQLTGAYFYAATAADVGPAFQQLQSKIIRLAK
jgi:Mg-chelatase subunit ChlD